MRRIVVTGLGAVTSLGQNVQKSWKNLINGRSGIVKIPASLFETSDLTAKIAGIIPTEEEDADVGFDCAKAAGRAASTMDRFMQLAVVAANEAISHSGWEAKTEEDSHRAGLLIGSGIGGLISIESNAIKLKELGARRISPYFIPASLSNLAGGHISIQHNMKGENFAVVSACASGAHSIGEAARIIRSGDADFMLAGASEAAVCRLGIAGFAAARTLSTNYNDRPSEASRPWDKGRDGFVMGEGAGVIAIEELEYAKKRGAKIIAELIGYGASGDAYHITTPSKGGLGAYNAMRIAVAKAGIDPSEIDHINAHSTSTPVGDPLEIEAIKKLYGDKNITASVTANKAAIGHLLGAAGSVEAIFSLMTLTNDIVPYTLNLEEQDEVLNGIDVVTKQSREQKITTVLSNSFGFGGTNAALIFRKFVE